MEEIDRIRLVDKEDNEVLVTKFGQMLTATRHDDILVRFEYGNSDLDVVLDSSGSATVTNSNSLSTITTGIEVSQAKITSLAHVTYHPGHEIETYFTCGFNPGTDSGSYLRAGIHDDNDGFYIGYNGSSFGVAKRTGGVTTFIEQADFNGDTVDGSGGRGNRSQFSLDTSKINIYRITYGWLGAAPISFAVYGGQDRGWLTMHIVDNINLSIVPTTESPSNHIRMEAGRTASSGSIISMFTASWNAASTGTRNGIGSRFFTQDFEITAAANTTNYVGTIRNNPTHLTKENKVRTELTFFGIATDGSKNQKTRLVKNASLTGANYTEKDANNSVSSYDISATISGGVTQMTFPMQKIDTLSFDATEQKIELFPGETLSITTRGSAASTISMSLRWKEVFS
jgi:hypothetical protein